MSIVKKLFRHGGSYAVDLPMSFVRHARIKEVIIDEQGDEIILYSKTELDTIESEPEFSQFIRVLAADALKHPEKLKEAKQVWDKEWDELLRGVSDGE